MQQRGGGWLLCSWIAFLGCLAACRAEAGGGAPGARVARGPSFELPADLRVDLGDHWTLERAVDELLARAPPPPAAAGPPPGGPPPPPLVYVYVVNRVHEYSFAGNFWLDTLRNALVSMVRAGVTAPALLMTRGSADVCEEFGRWPEDSPAACLVDAAPLPPDPDHPGLPPDRRMNYFENLRLSVHYALAVAATGCDVVLMDPDVVFLRDPTPLLAARDRSIQAQTEGYLGVTRIPGQPFEELNAGFFYVRSDPDTLRFLLEIYRECERDRYSFPQHVINRVLNDLGPERDGGGRELRVPSRNLTVRLLDTLLFPAGMEYFWAERPQRAGVRPYFVHANWAVRQEKRVLLRDAGLWYLDGPEHFQGRFLEVALGDPRAFPARSLHDELAMMEDGFGVREARFLARAPRPLSLAELVVAGDEEEDDALAALTAVPPPPPTPPPPHPHPTHTPPTPRPNPAPPPPMAIELHRRSAPPGPATAAAASRFNLTLPPAQLEAFDVVRVAFADTAFAAAPAHREAARLLQVAVTCCPTLTTAARATGLAWPFSPGCLPLHLAGPRARCPGELELAPGAPPRP
eukprot:tig00000624_g2653.t1